MAFLTFLLLKLIGPDKRIEVCIVILFCVWGLRLFEGLLNLLFCLCLGFIILWDGLSLFSKAPYTIVVTTGGEQSFMFLILHLSLLDLPVIDEVVLSLILCDK